MVLWFLWEYTLGNVIFMILPVYEGLDEAKEIVNDFVELLRSENCYYIFLIMFYVFSQLLSTYTYTGLSMISIYSFAQLYFFGDRFPPYFMLKYCVQYYKWKRYAYLAFSSSYKSFPKTERQYDDTNLKNNLRKNWKLWFFNRFFWENILIVEIPSLFLYL